MRAFVNASRKKTVIDGDETRIRRYGTENCERSILMAERAHIKLRMAAREGDDEMAADGVRMLKDAVALSPDLSGKRKKKSVDEYGRAHTRKKIVCGEED